MNEILKRTHYKGNIDLLKARDYYFSKAKLLDSIKTKIVLLPPIFLLITYLLQLFNVDLVSKTACDIFVGVFTILVIIAVHTFNHFIHINTDISNKLRMIYDSKVLDLKLNDFLANEQDIEKYLEAANKIKYNSNYEVWYSEVFCDNHNANVFCCQMDNLIYSKHTYGKAKKEYQIKLAVFCLFIVIAIVLSFVLKHWLTAFMIVFTASECIDVFLGKVFSYKEGLNLVVPFCNALYDYELADLNEQIINDLQEVVNKNRDLHVFLPEPIRRAYLRDGSPFYQELNKYKYKFMGASATIPEKASDIDVLYEDASGVVSLDIIHQRLRQMFEKVVEVLDEAKIHYALDGGTLIGAMREGNGFIPWDDDIDIVITIDQVENAKKVLKEKLEYVIQDAESEKYYSPRLSVFKIREQNSDSMISEKDSLLYDKYESRGLFIDVYAYSPILAAKPIDKLFRRLFIHPLNRKLEKVENSYPPKNDFEKKYQKFFKLKERYMKVLAFYRKRAKNTEYYAYFPGYIYDRKKAGPYHKASELFGASSNKLEWENKKYKVPANPDSVLKAYYGKWEVVPFKTKKDLVKEEGNENWYSKAKKGITALKHISYIVAFNNKKIAKK